MQLRVMSAMALALLTANSSADIASLSEAERNSAWFSPTLTVNDRPVCAEFLHAERTRFFDPKQLTVELPGLKKIRGGEVRDVQDPDVEVLSEHPGLVLTLPDEARAYIYFIRHSGCGGACETQSIGIESERLSIKQIYRTRGDADPRVLPASPEWELYKASDGEFYMSGVVKGHTQYHLVAGADRWELACDVALKPDKSEVDADTRQAFQAIETLQRAAGGLAQGAGNCGSASTNSRWDQARAEALEEAVYRPWALSGPQSDWVSANSWGDYGRIARSLEVWALQGLMEYRAFNTYRQQLSDTIATTAAFYMKKFGWSPARASEMATEAIHGAISRGFGFYGYEPYGSLEAELRHSILRRRNVEWITALPADPNSMDMLGEDSVLNTAIEYPKALSHLLKQGFDPNHANAFGKTPLMYAAQYNQIEAAKVLLAAGADPNAATIEPGDSCYYKIWVHGVTPLHYAVRYASAPMIQLLIEHGAVTFSNTVDDNYSGEDGQAGYPVHWLQKYAAAGGDERNVNITAAEVTALTAALRVPTAAERPAIAANWLARAEAAYSRGAFGLAYRNLVVALSAEPTGAKARVSLPLMALRAGRAAAAIKAAHEMPKDLADPNLQAAAWFNSGLVCEQEEVRQHGYDGYWCDDDWLQAFVRAWQVKPSAGRAKKLKQLFDKEGAGTCAPTGTKFWSVISRTAGNQVQRMYVLHKKADALDMANASPKDTSSPVGTLQIVERIDIDDFAITVLEDRPNAAPPTINGRSCTKQ